VEYKHFDGASISRFRRGDVENTAKETREGRLAGRAGAGEPDDQGSVWCMVVGHCPSPWVRAFSGSRNLF
jgi:hypothetical protein